MTTRAISSVALRTSADLARSGLEPWQQAEAVARGELHRIRRGIYVDGPAWRASQPHEQVVLRARAATTTRPSRVVFSHVTAGVLHGFPLVGPPPVDLDFVRVGASGGRSESGLTAHRSADPAEVVTLDHVDGVHVTSVERTLVDVAATRDLAVSLPMLDHALRTEATTTGSLREHLAGRSSLRARVRATRAVDLADGRSENAGEPLSRARILEAGFAVPDLQRTFALPDRSRAIADFYWEEIDLIGEFDGRLKYSRATGVSDPDALWREKRREDHLREGGHRVIRWGWDDAWRGEGLRQLLARAGVPRAGGRGQAARGGR